MAAIAAGLLRRLSTIALRYAQRARAFRGPEGAREPIRRPRSPASGRARDRRRLRCPECRAAVRRRGGGSAFPAADGGPSARAHIAAGLSRVGRAPGRRYGRTAAAVCRGSPYRLPFRRPGEPLRLSTNPSHGHR